MPGNVAGWRRRSLFWRRWCNGRITCTSRRHLGDDLFEQYGTRLWLLFTTFPMAKRMFGMACLADHLRHFAVDHARNRMIQKEPAARAVIVD